MSDLDLTTLEDRVDAVAKSGPSYGSLRLRDESFAALHEHAIVAFINSPGFGQSRMPSMAVWLRRWTFEATTIPQPDILSAANQGYRPDMPLTAVRYEPRYLDLHRDSFANFVNPEGFGYFKDRRHVGFFRPHQFRSPPTTSADLVNITLIGLVLHDAPLAYISDALPRMDLLRKSKVRPLDEFETLGLARIKAGYLVVSLQEGNRLRLLGAIRATKQCVECHGCERGDLLGAFSYVLRRH